MRQPYRSEVAKARKLMQEYGLMNEVERTSSHCRNLGLKSDDEFHMGACRCVIVSRELPEWVIKFDLYRHEWKRQFCAREKELFELAIQEGLDKFFAAIFYVGNGIYLQEKVECDEDAVASSFTSFVEKNLANQLHLDDIDEDDYYDTIRDYVEEDMDDFERAEALVGKEDKFLDFLSDYHINDLHDGNWGYRSSTGHYCVIDYAGY